MKRILVGLGGTDYTPAAIRWAVELAEAHEASLTGITVIDMARLEDVGPVPLGGSGAADQLREHRILTTKQRVEEAIASFEDTCKRANVRYEVREEKGDSFQLLFSQAHYHDLMMFGVKSIFDHGLHEDPDDLIGELVSRGIRPVIAVSRDYRPIRKVLMTYSGSMESAKTIRRFVQLRPWSGVELDLLVCHGDVGVARELLDDMLAYCTAHGLTPTTHHSTKSANSYVLEHAEATDADLIVLGNSSRRYLLRRILGETVSHIIQNAHRPLFLSQ